MQNKIKKIRTGTNFYKVEYVKELKDEQGTSLLGRTWLDRGLIRILNTLPIATQLRVTHHEATHGIFYEYNFGWNEKKVNIFSKAFYNFIIDNAEFVRQILKYAEKT